METVLTKVKITADTVMVSPINEEKALALVKLFVKEKRGQSFSTYSGALLDENVITDRECCYCFLDKHYMNGKIQIVYNIPIRIEKRTKKGRTIPLDPSFYFTIDSATFKTILDKEVSLREYMGSRFNYNPRIVANTSDFLKLLQENDYQPKTKKHRPITKI